MGDPTARGREVLLDGKVVVTAPSGKAAERMRRELEAMRELPEKKRAEAAKKLIATQFHPDVARAVRTADDGALQSLRVFASVHAVVVATLVTLVLMGHIERWRTMLVALGAMLVAGTFQFVRAHKKLWPTDRGQRWTRAVTCLLSPVALIKSPDVCTHDRLAELHMLAAVRAFMEANAGPMLVQALRDARHPGKDTWIDPNAKAQEAQREHRENLIAVLETIAPALSDKPASDNDEGVVVRCPRCGAGYTRQVSECFDCGAAIERVS
jgi:hypothetical protein